MQLLAPEGEVHISSKIDRPYDDWNIPGLVAAEEPAEGGTQLACQET